MARRIVWTKPAQADIREIAEFISLDSPAYAQNVVRRIIDATRKLERFPESGRQVDYLGWQLREIIADKYRIIYRVTEDRIVVLAVVHGSRSAAF